MYMYIYIYIYISTYTHTYTSHLSSCYCFIAWDICTTFDLSVWICLKYPVIVLLLGVFGLLLDLFNYCLTYLDCFWICLTIS